MKQQTVLGCHDALNGPTRVIRLCDLGLSCTDYSYRNATPF